MNYKRKIFLTAAVAAALMGVVPSVQAGYDENLNVYTLDTVVVEADKTQNKFGDTITEQSYYRTGGDVKVITREEIEKRHYTDATEAIKRIPGVTFQNPGYRGGEYGYQFYNNGVSINGDSRVIILVDGRRVDNAASTRISEDSTSGSKSTGVNLDQVTNMENIDKIEVIKGPGASVYGADATGGVINIITRKGGSENQGSIDLATGSWHKHHYAVNYSGAAGNDRSWHYFLSANRDMSGDTKYNDAFSSQDGTLGGSKWKEDGVNFRIDKDFSDKQNLKIWYNFRQGKDGYPIAVPNMKYWNENDWNRIIFNATVGELGENNVLQTTTNRYGQTVGKRLSGDAKNPGYHNLYALDGKGYGSFSKFKNNDWDIVYTFNKENGMDSFIRYYYQKHRYSNRDKYQWYIGGSTTAAGQAYMKAFPNGASAEDLKQWIKDNLAPFPGNEKALEDWVAKTGGRAGEPTSWHDENNYGLQLQYAKSIGINDIIANVQYDNAKNFSRRIRNGELISSHVKRTTTTGYIQDKIHINDKWDFTPSLRYSKYSAYENSTGASMGNSDSHELTYSMNTEYLFSDSTSAYMGWTRIFRPLRQGDYTITDYVFNRPLKDEKGNAWTFGVRHQFGEDTTLAVHYDWTRMTNAIATLPVLDPNSDDFMSTPINAKEDKKSFNITLDHNFGKHVTVSASYSHMKDKWKSKDGWTLGPEYGYEEDDINTAINSLRPENHYALNISYDNAKLYTGLLANWYTGCSRRAFTDNKFLVLDWNINYNFTKDLTVYAVVTNLTNEAYETSYNSWNGIGSSAMPGRCIMVGTKYKF